MNTGRMASCVQRAPMAVRSYKAALIRCQMVQSCLLQVKHTERHFVILTLTDFISFAQVYTVVTLRLR